MKFDKYEDGIACWADVSVQDMEKAKDFYSQVFGWEMSIAPEPEADGYTQCLKDGEVVCGIFHSRNPDQPAAWNTYFASSDIKSTIEKANEFGGTIIMPPIEVMNYGITSAVQDPQGAFFGIWQAKDMVGSTVANEFDTVCWNELATTNLNEAKDFYRGLFDWQDSESNSPEYWQYDVAGSVRGGAREMSEDECTMMPPNWTIYFRVKDLGETANKIEKSGGKILSDVMNADKIEFRACSDNQGAMFLICQFDEKDF
ncbi:MAG: VOC family protein [Acidimicrobiia bacterium]